MKFLPSLAVFLVLVAGTARADDFGVDGTVETTTDAVRVTVVRSGGENRVTSVQPGGGGGGGDDSGCTWTLVFDPDLVDTPYGTSAGPMPSPDARFALLLCDGVIVRAVWVAPSDVVDLDAAARAEAERYVKDVLVPAVSVGANPGGRGLVGLSSWYWIEGFSGSVTAPPIEAFGLVIDVRLRSGAVRWDFGDGTELEGDLGQAYPAESSVQHAHQRDGRFAVTATIVLEAEYRVDGGPWLPLPPLQAAARTMREVEERQAVVVSS